MNKYLAGYIFGGETLFYQKSAGSALTDKAEPVPVVGLPNTDVSAQKPAIVSEKPTESIQSTAVVQNQISAKRLVIIVNTLSEEEKVLLSKILISVKQELEKAEIIEMSKNPQAKLTEYIAAKEIISFGVAMSKLHHDLLLFPYQAQEKQAVKYLLVDDLKTIQANQKDEKKLLWAALKSFYGLT